MSTSRQRISAGVALACITLAAGCSHRPPAAWTEDRPFRVAITLDGIDWAIGRLTVVVPLVRAPGNAASIRLSEVDADGTVLNADAPFQLDTDGPRSELTLMAGGDGKLSGDRQFLLYFDDSGQYEPAPVGPRVEVTRNVEYQGRESLRIDTGAGQWTYDMKGAGFSRLRDHLGQDWIGHGPGPGATGEFRGIPNLVYPEGYFHPGGSACNTRVVAEGPLRVVLDAECGGGTWVARWEIFRLHARLTVLRAAHPFWFLYEGTPGGSFEADRDYFVLSDGRRFAAGESRDDDLPEPEWIYFGDSESDRVLWLAHEGADDHPDAYYPMEDSMTVFGFGRRRVRSFLSEVPTSFVVGLAPASDHPRISGAVETALSRPDIHVHPVELRPNGFAPD